MTDLTITAVTFALSLQRRIATFQSETGNPYQLGHGGDRFALDVNWKTGRRRYADGEPWSEWRILSAEIIEASDPGRVVTIDFAKVLGYERKSREVEGSGFVAAQNYSPGDTTIEAESDGGVLKGELFSVNGEIKEVMADSESDGDHVTIDFRPALRKPVAVGDVLEVESPTGNFLLLTEAPALPVARTGIGMDDNRWIGEPTMSFLEVDDFSDVVVPRVPGEQSLPVARFNASPNPAKTGQTVSLISRSSTADRAPLSHEWSSNPTVEFDDETASETSFVMPGNDVAVTLAVRKTGDGAKTARRTITIRHTTADPPGAITGLTGTPHDDYAALDWDDLADADAYEVQGRRGTSAYGTTREVTESEYDFLNLRPGTYRFRVRGVSDGGPGAWAVVDVIIAGATEKPDVPTGFDAVANGNAAQTSWDEQDDADSFELDHRRKGVVAWATIAVTGYARLVSNLRFNSTHQFQLRAKNSAGLSDNTEIFELAIGADPTAPPVDPTGLRTGRNRTWLTFEWDRKSDAVTYNRRYRRADSTGAYTTKNLIRRPSGAVIIGLQTGTEYDVDLQAVNANGTSNWVPFPNTRTLDAPKPPLGAPTGYSATGGRRQFALKWDDNDDASRWAIQYRLKGNASWNFQGANTNAAVVRVTRDNTLYEFRLAAYNSDNVLGAYTPVFESRTLEAVTPPPPLPTAISLRATMWNAARAQVPASIYDKRFQIRERNGAWGRGGLVVAGSGNDWDFTQLKGGTHHQARARHEQNGQQSPWRLSTEVATPPKPTAPGRIVDIDVTHLAQRPLGSGKARVRIEWDEPTGRFLFYFIGLRLRNEVGTGSTLISYRKQAWQFRNIVYHELIPGRRYYWSIRAEGGPTTRREFTTRA